MKKNFLKFGIVLLLATTVLACEKEIIETEKDEIQKDSVVSDKSTSADLIKTTKSSLNPISNPEEFLGVWKLQHIYYNDRDFIGDSTLWLFYTIEFKIDPNMYMGTPANLERVETKTNIYKPKFEYWKVSGKDVIFYDSYMKNVYSNDAFINTHYSLINYSISNTKLECDVWNYSGPAYKLSYKMHCVYTKVTDY